VASLLLWLIVVPFNGLLIDSGIFLVICILTLLSISKQKLQVEEVAIMTPSRLLAWDEGEVLKHLLIVCKTAETECPWAKHMMMS
jgi:hypothetical protein